MGNFVAQETAWDFAKRQPDVVVINLGTNDYTYVKGNTERKEDIKSKIAEKLEKDVVIEWGVDNDIIAGLIFKIDEMIIDNSIKHKLEDLSREIIKG